MVMCLDLELSKDCELELTISLCINLLVKNHCSSCEPLDAPIIAPGGLTWAAMLNHVTTSLCLYVTKLYVTERARVHDPHRRPSHVDSHTAST